MKFQIYQNKQPAVDSRFGVTAVLDYRARVTRVEKEFETVKKQTDNLFVRYPIEISKPFMAKAVTIKEEAPFTIGIKNVSSKPVGIRAGRLMSVQIVGVGGV
jgi:hypothetical protein